MELYILRHGLAEERAADGGGDSHRRLTDEGKKKMGRIASGMKRLGLDFEVVIASPYLRTKETAEIVVATLGIAQRLAISPTLASNDGNPQELIEELNRHHRQRRSILLVGHEPYLSQLISVLISGDERASITMKKGGLCKLAINVLRYGRCASLEWLIAPGQSKRIQ